MKRFTTSKEDGNQQTGGIPLYGKDLEFIQDAAKEVLYGILYGLGNKNTTDKTLTFQLGTVLIPAGSAGCISFGGYIMINGELYYCAPTNGTYDAYYVKTTEEKIAESNRPLASIEGESFSPWSIKKIVLTNESEGAVYISSIPTLSDYLFDELNKKLPKYKSLQITKNEIRKIPSNINFVLVTAILSNDVVELSLPPISDQTVKRIVIRFAGGGSNFTYTVKYYESVLFSKIGDEEAFNSTLVFEALYDRWILTSKTDI